MNNYWIWYEELRKSGFLKGVILEEKKFELTCFTIAVLNEEIPITPDPVKPGSSRKYDVENVA